MSRERHKTPPPVVDPDQIELPDFALVLMMGASGSGKSTWAAQNFDPRSIVSSDACRKLIFDQENGPSGPTFELLHFLVAKRLEARRFTVVDATNTRKEDRAEILQIAHQYHCPTYAIWMNPKTDQVYRNNQERERSRPDRVVREHLRRLRNAYRELRAERLNAVWMFKKSPAVCDSVVQVRSPVYRPELSGPFDLIGDVHSCYDELTELIGKLGYPIEDGRIRPHPENRTLVFLGDLIDRGPDPKAVLNGVRNAVEDQIGFCLMGNHERKLMRVLDGRAPVPEPQTDFGSLLQTLETLSDWDEPTRLDWANWIGTLPHHLVLDRRRLVAAHAGLPESMHGRDSKAVQAHAWFGLPGPKDPETGLPERLPWENDYNGRATVVYGHTPVRESKWVNRTICIDNGVAFGGRLTALRYPENELMSVPARETWCDRDPKWQDPKPEPETGQNPDGPDGIHVFDPARTKIDTQRFGSVRIDPGQTLNAIRAFSDAQADPRSVCYLPPTISPGPTSRIEGWLERPEPVFEAYARAGVSEVVAEEKHMGSRGLIWVGRTPEALEGFGIGSGSIWTRTGRDFFDPETATGVLERVRSALDRSGFWNQYPSDWVLLDSEIMPWNLKAGGLIRRNYESLAVSALQTLEPAVGEMDLLADRNVPDADQILKRVEDRSDRIRRYRSAYEAYLGDIREIRVAPFHVLASSAEVFFAERDHAWHMQQAEALAQADPSGLLVPTAWAALDPSDESAVRVQTERWEQAIAEGSEGFVVKPLNPPVPGPKGIVDPALKVRGRDYLRIIYGPDYLEDRVLKKLKNRRTGTKRKLARNEHMLGVEGLDRLVRGENWVRVHECVLGTLAVDTEPTDPRL